MGISDDTTLTATDKAKIKEEYGLWEQKTGINAKEGGVGILGIRTRQLMHERRLELLEALRNKPCALLLLLVSQTDGVLQKPAPGPVSANTRGLSVL